MQSQDPEDPGEKIRRLLASEDETQVNKPSENAFPKKPTNILRRPAVDEHGMPLPNRVEEIDMSATRVASASYEKTPTVRHPALRRHRQSKIPPVNWRKTGGCLLYGMIAALFVMIALGLILLAAGIVEYYRIASTLPSVDDLRAHASQFETTRILDRNGNLLYEILDPNAGRRTYVTLDKISPNLVAATIATEDKDFYSHPGFDLLAILRAVWNNVVSGGEGGGASTITQQLARTLLLSPEERSQKTFLRKLREIILAAEITRRYDKNEILELYLNEIYYGNLAYGVEAATETYFSKSAGQLTLGEAAFLAGLPQAPSVYDIHTNREAALKRDREVLVLMYQVSHERGCIYVSISPDPVCVDASSAALAYDEIQNYPFRPTEVNMRYPHWVQYVRSQLEAQFDSQTIYRSGFTITTTLDPGLQDTAQQLVSDQVAALTDLHVTDGALVAIRPSTGEILTMVGSADFYNVAISGQVNMAVSQTRQPGSSIKPFTYTAAFEKGWTPATLIWDVPSEFPPSGDPNDTHPPWVPVNYDQKFHGPVTVRTALANSYNIPAVKTLQFIGVYGDSGLIAMTKRLGFTSLTRDDYGLGLTLGGGEVSLLEMTSGYAVFANSGLKVPPVAILKITDHSGDVVYQYDPPSGEQVIRPEHAFLITSILSDNEARAPMFGRNSLLNLPFPVAAKTGTTNEFRDNWTLGYTPDLAVGVWVGNADYTPMVNTTGLTGAAPIWSQFMQIAIQQLTGGNPTPFNQPAGLVTRVICAESGTEPSEWCPNQRSEYFAADQPPLPASQDLWQKILIDTWTNLRASKACSKFTEEKFVMNVTDPFARTWILQDADGQEWAREMGFGEDIIFTPARECTAADPQPQLDIIEPKDNQEITKNKLDIYVVANASENFKFFRLDYGLDTEPTFWTPLVEETDTPVDAPVKVYTWDLTTVTGPVVSLRLYMENTSGGHAEKIIQLNLRLPTPTTIPTLRPTATHSSTPKPAPSTTRTPLPSITPSFTPKPAPSSTPTTAPTMTPVPSETPTPTDTPTSSATVIPSDTPTASETPTPTSTDTSTPGNTP